MTNERHEKAIEAWLPPSTEMTESPEFEAVWNVIRNWDIAVPGAYGGYCSATGNHVRAILDALPNHFTNGE